MTKNLSEAEVRNAFFVALVTTGTGEGDDEQQVMDFALLTRALNDALENEE